MKTQFTLVTLIIIALIGIWSVLEDPEEASVAVKDTHFVDAYAKDFTMFSMNEHGQPYYTLTASLMDFAFFTVIPYSFCRTLSQSSVAYS